MRSRRVNLVVLAFLRCENVFETFGKLRGFKTQLITVYFWFPCRS
jgi:hypothetical protein